MDAEEAQRRWSMDETQGIGAVLAPSGLCSLDLDDPDHALAALTGLGIDLGALREVTPTIQGNPARYRLIFKAPPGAALSRKALVWPARETAGKPITLFELRGGDIQDVLPPTVHPETGKPYVWAVPPNSEFPPLPEALLELWQNWESYRKELEGMCPWGKHGFNPEPAPRGDGARPNVIAAFNAAHPVEELLEAHGYTRRGKRWISPTSSSGLAGAVILDDGKVYSHHSSDLLFDGHAHDAFDLFRILDHNGDARSAVKAAAEELGIGPGQRTENRFGGNSEANHHHDKHGEAAGDHTTKATTAPLIIVRAGELPRIVSDAVNALKDAGVPIYVRGDALYRPVRIETHPSDADHVRRPIGALVLRPVDPIWVRLKLASVAKWQK